jgi:hypothetical protein
VTPAVLAGEILRIGVELCLIGTVGAWIIFLQFVQSGDVTARFAAVGDEEHEVDLPLSTLTRTEEPAIDATARTRSLASKVLRATGEGRHFEVVG